MVVLSLTMSYCVTDGDEPAKAPEAKKKGHSPGDMPQGARAASEAGHVPPCEGRRGCVGVKDHRSTVSTSVGFR